MLVSTRVEPLYPVNANLMTQTAAYGLCQRLIHRLFSARGGPFHSERQSGVGWPITYGASQ